MTNPAPVSAETVTARQIADLLAWARSLAEQGAAADPAERAAFLATKHELLNRLTHNNTAQHNTAQHDTGRRH
jgi:hypothetical protein